ncbi:hypothetical protein KP509_03G012900 [Ceratopteris richardii]|uniref:Uncharacterized protein n=1 Tax=Ceratopteris richardii TaxID=49495 RepID=A0A8T2V930_CERRI|nr:hypothetical protein KP509_03G012900 [Ceratopteris richardii]
MHSESGLQARTCSADRMESLKNTCHFNTQHIRGGRYGRPFGSAASAKFMSIQEAEDEGEEKRLEEWKQVYRSGRWEHRNTSCSSSSPSPSVSSSSSTSASFSSLTPPCSQTIGAEGTVSEGMSRLRRPPIYSTVTLLTIIVLLLLLLPLVLPPLPPPPLEVMLLPVLILAFLMSSALFHRGSQLSVARTSHFTCTSNRLAFLFDV